MLSKFFNQHSATVLSGAMAAAVGAGTLLWYMAWKVEKEFAEYDERIQLMAAEESGIIYSPAVSTITFYSGDISQHDIKGRFTSIVKENPWLAGRLRKIKDHMNVSHLNIVYKKDFNETDINQYYQEIIVDPSNDKRGLSAISEKMSIHKITEILRPELVKLGAFCIGKAKEPLVKVIVLKFIAEKEGDGEGEGGGVKSIERSAMMFSLSHVLGDGHTYYNFLSFFGAKKPIKRLIAQRIPEGPTRMDPIYLKQLIGYLTSTFIIAVLYTVFFRPKPEMYLFTVDQKKIDELKQAYQAESQVTNHFTAEDKKDFISTNDIITSWYFQTMKSDYGLMAMNYRNRLEGYTDDHAGNYEGLVIYNKSDYQTPADIRESVRRLSSKSKQLPTLRETWNGNFAIITNWASFYHAVHYPSCENIAHFPLMGSADVAVKDLLIIFQMKPNQLGLWLGSRSFQKECLGKDSPIKFLDSSDIH